MPSTGRKARFCARKGLIGLHVASRGPVPKRVSERLGHNSAEENEVSRGTLELEEKLGPEPPEWLDGFALDLYESFRTSGQAIFYAPSDWAVLTVICRHIMATIRKPSAMMLSAILSGLGTLGATEGDRRRIKIELTGDTDTRAPEDIAAVTDISDFLHIVDDPDEDA